MIKEAKKRTKKLIIAEPCVGMNPPHRKIPVLIYKFYDKFFGDNDGINDYDNRKNWDFKSQQELLKYLKNLGLQKIVYLGKNKKKFIAVF